MSRMYVDVLYGRDAPRAGWYLQAIGRRGDLNSCYRVLTARKVNRKDPRSSPRITMEVEMVDEVPASAEVFEFRWYPRGKKRKLTFEQHMRRKIS